MNNNQSVVLFNYCCSRESEGQAISATRGLLASNLDQVTRTMPELASRSPNYHTTPLSGPLSLSWLAAVAEWYRYRIVAGFVTSSSPVPLKTLRVGQRCMLNLSRAETFSRWCGVW
ncbi:uncharacterized protein TNCV_2427441 [Trichonephila clavipes]|nr:uncharacterized protein TNCV_2427441 [Trichonephila clavipes]